MIILQPFQIQYPEKKWDHYKNTMQMENLFTRILLKVPSSYRTSLRDLKTMHPRQKVGNDAHGSQRNPNARPRNRNVNTKDSSVLFTKAIMNLQSFLKLFGFEFESRIFEFIHFLLGFFLFFFSHLT